MQQQAGLGEGVVCFSRWTQLVADFADFSPIYCLLRSFDVFCNHTTGMIGRDYKFFLGVCVSGMIKITYQTIVLVRKRMKRRVCLKADEKCLNTRTKVRLEQ